MTHVLTLGRAELRLISRNRTVAFMALLFPLAMGAYFATQRDLVSGDGWGAVAVLQIAMILGFTLYATPATSLTTRRQDLFLKRLRSGELSDGGIIAGLLAPLCVLALVQAGVLFAILGAAGATAPANLLLLAVAVVLAAAMSLGAAVATSGFTPTAESAQLTTLPFFFIVVGGAVAGTAVPDAHDLFLLVPGWACGTLIDAAWSGVVDWSVLSLALAAQAAWTALAWAAARRLFRWEPRT